MSQSQLGIHAFNPLIPKVIGPFIQHQLSLSEINQSQLVVQINSSSSLISQNHQLDIR